MYLESLTIKNFRKFGNDKNTVYFVASKAIKPVTEEASDSLLAPSSTLIIGKNNAGKTTIAKALKLIADRKKPKAYDFNIRCIKAYLDTCEKAQKENTDLNNIDTPYIEFKLQIRVNMGFSKGNRPDDAKKTGNTNETANESDLVNNLYQFVPISSDNPDLVEIIVKYEIKESTAFTDAVSSIIHSNAANNIQSSTKKIDELYKLLEDESLYKLSYYTASGVQVVDPALSELINVREIKANRHLKEGILSDVYQKIIAAQFEADEKNKEVMAKIIVQMNEAIDGSTALNERNHHISAVLNQIEPSNKVDVQLSGNVGQKQILSNLIKYSFSEGEDYIPEDQFGLGYINLLNIIGEIIHYVDGYEDKSYQDKINLLFIEEPEAFMHPQMQEFFINRIDNAVKKVLEQSQTSKAHSEKELHCQIAITTHSSHIVNSKIHSSNSFNNINYLATSNRQAKIVKLDDKVVSGGDSKSSIDDLTFIKKHIKYKVSELFFADAVILVEGVTEETLLHYYLDKKNDFRHHHISIFNINGAHAKLYFPLIQALLIPCLIITDTDIKREPCEKNENNLAHSEQKCKYCGKTEDGDIKHRIYKQITELNDRKTTNQTLIWFDKKEKGTESYAKSGSSSEIEEELDLAEIDYFEYNNLRVVFQKAPIEGQYATSFEEAYILTNYQNKILNEVLKDIKPRIYERIVSDDTDYTPILSHSYELQRKLSSSKSSFANSLLFNMLNAKNDRKRPKLPLYIEDGLNWLSGILSSATNAKESVHDTSK